MAGAKGVRLGRAGTHQYVAREADQLFLRRQREIANVAAGQLAGRVEAGESQPFGMDMKLYLVPSCDDRADDHGNDLRTIDERGHRVAEEYAGQPVAFGHVHLEMDAKIATPKKAEDRENGRRTD